MNKIEELDLILELIKKYELPLSPILEYAIGEKKQESLDEQINVQQEVEDVIEHEDSADSVNTNIPITDIGEYERDYSTIDFEVEHIYLDNYSTEWKPKEAILHGKEDKGLDHIDVMVDYEKEHANIEYVPKDNFKNIKRFLYDFSDYVWIISLIELIADNPSKMQFSKQELGLKVITNSLNIIYRYSDLKYKESKVYDYLQKIVSLFQNILTLDDYIYDKDKVFSLLQSNADMECVKDAQILLDRNAVYKVIRAWINSENTIFIDACSRNFAKSCMYATDYYDKCMTIKINPMWVDYICSDCEELLRYFEDLLLKKYFINR